MRAGTLSRRLTEPHIAEALGGGFRPLVDKDGEIAAADLPGHPGQLSKGDIAPEDFDFVVRDFLFQAVWAAKHVRRGELWAAKDDVDGYMKADLVRMIEWHTVATRPGTATRSEGRYLEKWAHPRIVASLPAVFALYEPQSVAAALKAMLQLFRRLAVETADALGYGFPGDAHRAITVWVEDCLAVYS